MACNLEQDFWDNFTKGDLDLILDNDNVQKLFSSTINGKTAAKILKHLTKVIVELGDKDCKNQHNILITSRFLLECVQSKPSDVDVSVLSCIFYISKQFIRKGNLEMALGLKSYVMNYKGEFTTEIMKVYYGLFYQLHTSLEQQHALYDIDMKLKIRYESLEFLSCCGANYLHIILSESYNFVNPERVHGNRMCHLEYAVRMLKLIKNISENCIVKENSEVVSKLYVQFLSNLMMTVLSDMNGIQLEKLLDVIDIVQTSSDTCNKLMYFFVKMLKGMLDIPLPVTLIREQTPTLQDMIENGANSLLFSFCFNFVRVFCPIQAHWLATLSVPLSCEELLVVSELAILLSSFLKKNIVSKHSSVGPSASALASFRVIINLLSFGVNFILSQVHDDNAEDIDKNVLEIFKMVLTVQALCFDLLVLLRDNDRSLWKDPWRVLASRSVKLATVLTNKKCYEHASKVYLKFLCCFFEVERVFEGEIEYICTEVNIQKVFKGLVQCLVQLQKHKEALVNIGVAVLVLPDDTRELQKSWIFVKQRAVLENNLNLQGYTMCSVFQESKGCIEATFTDISCKILNKLNSSTLCRLLLWEAESYLQYRSQFSEAICAVGKSLMKNCSSTLIFAEGIELVLSGTWMENALRSEFSEMYRRAVDVLTVLSMNVSEDDRCLSTSLLGNVHYYYFFAEVTVLRKKLQENITNIKDKFPSKDELGVMKGNVDPSEAAIKSNLITAYADLDVHKEHELLNILQKAVDVWSRVHVSDKKIIQISADRFERLLSNIKTTACTFALYGYYAISLKVWMLYYQLCKSSDYDTYALCALSQLLEFSCYVSDNKLWMEAIGIGNSLLREDMKDKEKEILFNFLLARSNSCLINEQYEDGWKYLQKLNSLSIPGTFTAQLSSARKHILLSKYYLCSSNISVLPEDFKEGDAFLSVSQALKILKQLCQIKTLGSLFESCSLNLLMMDAAEWMGNLWLGLKMYRDGYSHLKKYLFLAQMLGLASRCTQIVSKLAQFDILLHEVENTEVKVLGMETMLCVRNMPPPSLNDMEVVCTEEMSNKSIGNLCLDEDFVRMKLLDVPTPARRNHMSSPELQNSPFKMPSLVNHGEDCTCLFCNCLLLQNVIMETICIKAHLNVLKGRNDIAMSFFKGGMKFAKKIQMLQEKFLCELSKIVHGNIGSSLYVSLSDPFLINFSKLSMDYTEFLYLSSCHNQSLLQNMIASSHNTLLNSQEYNLLIGLEMIDMAQLLYTENTKLSSTAPETIKKNLIEEFNAQECLESRSQEIMKTPMNREKKVIDVPAVHRNEDRMYLSKMSPLSIVNLDDETPLVKAGKDGKLVATGQRKFMPLVCNDTIVLDDSDMEDDPAMKSKETAVDHQFSCENENHLNPCLTSDDSKSMGAVHSYKKDIELVTSGIEEIKISSANGSQAFHIASKTGKSRQQQEGKLCSSTRQIKSALVSALLKECNTDQQTEVCGKSIDYRSSEETEESAKYFKTSPFASEYDSPFGFGNSHQKNQPSRLVLPVQRKYFKRTPKVIIYTDSPESNVASADDVTKENDKQTTEKNTKEYKVPETDKTLFSARKQRKPRDICLEEKTALMDFSVPIRTRNIKKKEKSEIASNVSITIRDTSVEENSVDVKRILRNGKHLGKIDCHVSSHMKSKEMQSCDAPERKTTRTRRKSVSLDDTDLTATPVSAQSGRKALCQTSVRKKVTRTTKRNPFILD